MKYSDDIAIIGIAGRFPDATTLDQLHQNLRSGVDSIRAITPERVAATTLAPEAQYRRAGYIADVDKFDFEFFQVSKAEAQAMDPLMRLLLEVVHETFENAGYSPDAFSGTRCAVFVGDASTEYYKHADSFAETLITGNSPSFFATRITKQFNLTGNAVMVNTACSSSHVALHMAINELLIGEADHALVCGANLYLFPFYDNKNEMDIWSPDGKSRAFSEDANGMSNGEVVASVLLKPLARAVADHDHIHAVIRGSAINNNANRSKSPYSPDSITQSEVIRLAWQKARVLARDISFIEAHGSGTQLGDMLEIEGLTRAFAAETEEKKFCPISTVKSTAGHGMSGAGIFGLIKTVLQLRHRELYPNLHTERLNPLIDFERSAVFVNQRLTPWVPARGQKVLLAGVTSLGASGTNVHVVLQEAPPRPVRTPRALTPANSWFVPISARTEQSLEEYRKRLAAFLRARRPAIEDIAFTLAAGRRHHSVRAAVVATTLDDLIAKLDGAPVSAVVQPARAIWLLSHHQNDVAPWLQAWRGVGGFDEHLRVCGEHLDLASSRGALLALHISLYRTLTELGLTAENIVPVGVGKLALQVVMGEQPLENVARQLSALPEPDLKDVDERARRLVSSLGERGVFHCIDLGGASSISDAIRRLDGAGPRICVPAIGPREEVEAAPGLFQDLYLSGCAIDFRSFAAHQVGSRIELPTYAFAKTRCWIRERPRKGSAAAVTLFNDNESHLPVHEQSALRGGGTDIEVAIAAAFCDVLQIEDVGMTDNFFLLGGDSLLATKVIGAINREFGTEIAFEDLYEHPSVGALATSVLGALQLQDKIAWIWRSVLKLERLAPSDDFFNLGGHSLLANQVLVKVRALVGATLDFDEFFAHPTLDAFTRFVESKPRDARLGLGGIGPAPAMDDYPLSSAQRQLWVLSKLDGGTVAYNSTIAYEINGALDREALARSLDALIDRHESLRTVFSEVDGVPRQRILAPGQNASLRFVDLGVTAEGKAEASRLVQEEERTPVNLTAGPLLRTLLVRIAEAHHVLAVTMHHIVSDGWSARVFARDLAAVYGAAARGAPNPLPALSLQYKDFAHWQLEVQPHTKAWHDAEEYWLKRLSGELPTLELPSDRRRPAQQTFEGRTLEIAWSSDLLRRIEGVCRAERTTPYAFLVAAVSALFHRYTSQRDIVFGSVAAGRSAPELDDQIGCYVTTFVLKTEVDANLGFADLLRATKRRVQEAIEHSLYPFDVLVERLAPPRDPSRSPLFDVMVNFQNVARADERLHSGGLTLQAFPFERGISQLDLVFGFEQVSDWLELHLEYNVALFDEARIARMVEHLERLVRAAVIAPETAIWRLPLLSDEEHRTLASFATGPTLPYPTHACVHQLFSERAQASPEAVAVTCAERSLTYHQLDALSNQLARRLQRSGAGPAAIVGLAAHRSPEMLIALLAILKTGAAYMPIDVTHPAGRVAYVLEDSCASLVIVDERAQGWERLGVGAGLELVPLNRAVQESLGELADAVAATVSSEHLAYVIYTSGSTGRPKGVMVPHRGVVQYLSWCREAYPLEEGVGAPLVSSLAFDLSVTSVLAPLLVGRTVLLPDAEDGDVLGDDLTAQGGFSLIKLTPVHLRILAERVPSPLLAGLTRALVVGGEELHADDVATWQHRARGVRIFNEYGPTETVVGCTAFEVPQDYADTGGLPIGRPIANANVYILDEHLQPTPIGVPGEIYVSGAGVARGYLRKPALTAERFIPDPSGDGTRMYRTGDLGRHRSDGQIEFFGRRDNQVKVRGHRIELGEIEAQLRALPTISDVAVVAEDSHDGKRLIAYLVRTATPTLALSEVAALLRDRLPAPMLPAEYIELPALPVAASGKVNRRALPPPVRATGNITAPRTLVERRVHALLQDVLGATHELGVDASLFDLGGNSLTATRLAAKLHKEFGVRLRLADVFGHATVAKLAVAIEQMQASKAEGIPKAPVQPDYPLSYGQRGLWVLSQLEEGTLAYNNTMALDLFGRVDEAAVLSAFESLTRRHEILRTVFVDGDGGPRQRVLSEDAVAPVTFLDLTAAPDPEAAMVEEIERVAGQPIDLARGPLLRATVGRVSDLRSVLAITTHHIIGDGWSEQVVARDLAAFYDAHTRQLPIHLEPLLIQYKDFAVWQRHILPKSPEFERAQRYWLQILSGELPLLELPTDRPRPPIRTFRAQVLEARWPRELAEAIDARCRSESVTLFMFLLAAIDVLLHRTTQQHDLIVGVPTAGRMHKDLEHQVGYYLSVLPLRVQLSGHDSFRDVLRQVRTRTLEGLEHALYPFDLLVETLAPKRDLSRPPIFDVMMVLHNHDSVLGEVGLHDHTLSFAPFPHRRGAIPFALSFEFERHEDSLRMRVSFNVDLFDRDRIERMAEHLENVLRTAAADPVVRVASVDLLSSSERAQLSSFHGKTRFVDGGLSVHHFIERWARHDGERSAIRCARTREVVSYASLNRAANKLARCFEAKGLRQGQPIALLLERGAAMITAILAAWKLGAYYIPLDRNDSTARLRGMVCDARVRFVVSADRDDVAEKVTDGLDLKLFVLADHSAELRALSGTDLGRPYCPASAAYVLFTSGSSGRPKGAMVEHRGMMNHIQAKADDLEIDRQCVLAQTGPHTFDISVWQFFAPLVRGGCTVIFDNDLLLQPEELVAHLAKEAVTTLELVPSHIAMLLEAHSDRELDLRSLRALMATGDTCKPQLVARWLQRMPGVPIWNSYGPTECSDDVVHFAMHQLPEGEIPLGRPIINTQIYVVDPHLALCPIGVPGEICIGGVAVGNGYVGESGKTAAAFRPSPFGAPGERLYHTGDIGRWTAQGVLEFLGRADNQVKINGNRIELGEVEALIAELSQVKDVCAVAREDAKGQKQLCCYVVPRDREDAQTLKASLIDHLVSSKFRPHITVLESLPLSKNGKIDRRALPQPAFDTTLERRLPSTPTERVMHKIWRELLESDASFGVDDGFFDVGGNSLSATRLAGRVGKEFGIRLPLAEVFRLGTIAKLSKRIDEYLLQISSAADVSAPSGASRTDRTLAPASPLQSALWFIDRMNGGSANYNIVVAFQIASDLDPERLRHSVRAVAARHESLRTHFREDASGLLQIIEPEAADILILEDLRDREAPADTIRELGRREAAHVFDLEGGPLVRIVAARLRGARTALLVNVHHIVSDGWSLRLLLDEIATGYFEPKSGSITDGIRQYREYVAAQSGALSSDASAKVLDFWRAHLLDAPATVDLPFDFNAPASGAATGRHHSFALSPSAHELLKSYARSAGATTYMVLLATFAAFVHRTSHQQDFVIGTATANREDPDYERTIGYFANMLPLRLGVTPRLSFAELVARVRDGVVAALSHQQLPFQSLVKELQPERVAGQNPIFQIAFIMEDLPTLGGDREALAMTPVELDGGAPKFDLTLSVTPQAAGWVADFEYRTDRFSPETVERFAQRYGVLLDAALRSPHVALGDLPMMRGHEAEALLRFEVGPQTAPDGEQSVTELFEAQAAANPGAIAVRFDGTALSYADLNARANRLGRYLQSLGARANDCVGIHLPRGTDFVVAILATLKAGAAWVPLDPHQPDARLLRMVEGCRIRIVLTSTGLRRLHYSSASAVDIEDIRHALDCLPADDAKVQVHPDQIAYVIHTSGSTGIPKGVAVPHRGIANIVRYEAALLRLTPMDRVLLFSSFSFDVSVTSLFVPLSVGASAVIATDAERHDPLLLDSSIRREKITVAFLPPIVAANLDSHIPVRALLVGGDVCPSNLRSRFAAVPEFLNAYGPTETSVFAAYARLPRGWQGATVPIGTPPANTRLHVLDPELARCAPGVPGELFVAGVQLARGYVSRPDWTAERFLPNPFGPPGSRMYRSGDRARFAFDGQVEFLGRLDHQVKVRGFRIELAEVEAALLAEPSVAACVAVVREDRPGHPELVAYIVRSATADSPAVATERHLREQLRATLPDYMIPVAIVELEALPLSRNGKVDRSQLSRPPERRLRGAGGPLTPLEEKIACIWREALGSTEAIDRDDDFFALGGHSLLVTQIRSRLHDQLGVELDLRAIFAAPTLAAFAEQVEAARHPEALPVPSISRQERGPDLPLSFAQERLFVLEQLQPGTAAYNVPVAVRLQGPVDFGALERALAGVIQRHDVLRTRLHMKSGTPIQSISPRELVSLPREDLSGITPVEREGVLRERIAREVAKVFDLAGEPPLRARVLSLARDEHVFVLTVHHIATDGHSQAIFLRELSALYAAECAGCRADLPDLRVQYADFAAWQRRHLTPAELERDIAYWKAALAGSDGVVDLPTDYPPPTAPSFRGASVPVTIPDETLAGLRLLCREEGVTLYMALLATFQLLLARYSGQRQIAVGTPVAGREREELQGLIGFFVNLLVMRTDVTEDLDFRGLLRRVRQVALGAFAHQQLPFARLVKELGAERSFGRTPLFHVLFAFQSVPNRELALGDVVGRILELENTTAKFDLALNFLEGDGQLSGELEYATDLFERRTVMAIATHFVQLLQSAVTAPSLLVGRLPYLPAAERRRLLVDWNSTAARYPSDQCIHEVFALEVRRRPDAIAVEAGDESVSYRELDERANQLAHVLREYGVSADARVALCMDRSVLLVVALLAVSKAGGAYVPLDPAAPKARLATMLEDTRPLVLLVTKDLAHRLPECTCRVLRVDELGARLKQRLVGPPVSRTCARNLAYVIFTSGSTGRPKGVAVEHRSVLRLVKGVEYASLTPEHTFLLIAPIAFDASTLEIWGCLLNGGRLVLYPSSSPGDPAELRKILRRHGVTTLHLTSGLFAQIVDADLESLKGLQQVLTGGDVVSAPHVRRVLEQLRIPVTACYGPTENTTFTTCWRMNDANAVSHSVPIGKPIANTQVYVLDRHLEPVPVGHVGELYAGGDGLARSYINQPALTAERFIPHPFSDVAGARLYRTGDLVRYRADGVLEFVGRSDDQVKIRGYRVEPREVESALAAVPGVDEAVVLNQPDPGGGRRLVGYVASAENITPDRVRAAIQDTLPEYMIPAIIVVLPALPLTSNGKIDRESLPRATPRLRASPVAPRSALEQRLVAIWEQALALSGLGVEDDFFELGGQSLAAIRLVHAIEVELGFRLPVSALFEAPTAAKLARRIDARRGPHASSAIVPLSGGDQRPIVCCFNPIGGHPLAYAALARRLHPLTVYGVEPLTNGASSRIPDVAAQCVSALQAQHQHGPYVLVGWSSGGAVAFEAARQLEAAGVEPLLVLLDAFSPATMVELLPDRHALAEGRRHWERRAVAPAPYRQFLVNQGLASPDADSQTLLLADFDRLCADVEALRAYHPGHFSGSILELRALHGDRLRARGWASLSTLPPTVRDVPGDHFSLLREADVAAVAAAILDHLISRAPGAGVTAFRE